MIKIHPKGAHCDRGIYKNNIGFLQNRIDVFEFEEIYWDKFINDKNFSDEYYEPLNRLLTDIDEFKPDEELRGDDTVGDSLSEEDLRECAKKALKQIALLK
ncbi:colicin immunity domain-containing protein [uncultured Campylobacter sp.]|uniref:colicin immunity domain-containing protein n=1 Tax=uncultured Campylobacter sp. TaxID=218934 RepID=UPI0026150F5F|nr:colicin immunity domain-containing protein [uncultured Campylobacter sp.]